MLIDDNKLGAVLSIIWLVGFGVYVLIDHVVRMDRPKPAYPEERRNHQARIFAIRGAVFVVLYIIIMITSGIFRRNTVDVFTDAAPGTVVWKKYAAPGEVKEAEGVPVDVTGPGGYYAVNKTAHPIIISSVYYDEGVLVRDSTQTMIVPPGGVGEIVERPYFWGRPAPERHSTSGRGGSIPAEGYYYSLEITGVRIKGSD